MKKLYDFITIAIMAIIMSMVVNAHTANAATLVSDNHISATYTHGKTVMLWHNRPIHTYTGKYKVRIIPTEQLTRRMLWTRTRTRTIYIEVIQGKVINRRLDGRDSNGKYISYRSLRGKVRRGSRITTYYVYNPNTRWLDDIDERYDAITRK